MRYLWIKDILASMTLVIVWALSIVTSVVFAQEGICKLHEYPRPADYTGDKNETEVFQTNNNITFCDQRACRGISNEELKACNDGSFPSFDEYLRLLKYSLKSKSDCELTGTLASFLPVLQTVFTEMRLGTGVSSLRRFPLENVEIHLKDNAAFAKTRHHYNTWTLIVMSMEI
ncbi:hypothetical protein MAR_033758 [Mya arenaria]|uniref:Uncharacterized protein n=1 Tax=Mya arenaria TaxID=6604 RepID=A0ABY7GE30_MYAAR|nr:hypothetical protein MAR_033758 [Mya arenaria]